MSLWQVMACALALCLAGMLVLSQVMDRHCDQLVSRGEPGPALRVVLRLAGAARISEGLTTLEEVLACTPPVQ